MFASLENVSNEFKAQLTNIIKQQCKTVIGTDSVDMEKERASFEEKYLG